MKLGQLWERLNDVSVTASVHEDTVQLCATLPITPSQRTELESRDVSSTPTTYRGLDATLRLADLVQAIWPELLHDPDNAELYGEVFEQAAMLAGAQSKPVAPPVQTEARHVGYVLTDPIDGAPNVYCEVLMDATHGPALIVRASPSLILDVQLTESSARRLAELLLEASSSRPHLPHGAS